METSNFYAVANLLAIVGGPILAVFVTRYIDKLRARNDRRLDLFRVLMRTRRMALSAEHVAAINLVEIDFAGEKDVIQKRSDYFKALGTDVTRMSPAEHSKFFAEREALLAKLLHSIAKVLGVKMEQLDIFSGGYVPQGWLNLENQQAELRLLALDLLRGDRALPVTQFAGMTGSNYPFPPPPKMERWEPKPPSPGAS